MKKSHFPLFSRIIFFYLIGSVCIWEAAVLEKVLLFPPEEKENLTCLPCAANSTSLIILLFERIFVSNLIIAFHPAGKRMGVLFTDSANVNSHSLVRRVPSPPIPSWTRKAGDGDSPSRILTSCLAIPWKPIFCPRKWERKRHLMVHCWVFISLPLPLPYLELLDEFGRPEG